MTDTTRPAPFFLAEDRALDFVNSNAAPWGTEIEWIANGPDLLDWLEVAALVPAAVLNKFRKEAAREDLDSVAARARELREWFRAFLGDYAGQPLRSTTAADLATLNRLLAQDDTYRQLEAIKLSNHDRGTNRPAVGWRHERRWHSPEALLLPLAEAMGDLVSRADFACINACIKNCEGPTCTMWFLDCSQNHTRRWCSMAVCGNRAKVAAYRARKRSASGVASRES